MTATRALELASASPGETRRIGGAIATVLEPGDVVLLVGDLGAGKTTLVKGLVEALGGGDAVTSPTFTLCHVYPSTPPVAHVDAWRMSNLGEALDLALEEVLDEGAVAVVEWGEALAPLYGSEALVVELSCAPGGEDERAITLHGAVARRWQRRIAEVERRLGEAGRNECTP